MEPEALRYRDSHKGKQPPDLIFAKETVDSKALPLKRSSLQEVKP
jgi:hypothetical protein